LKARRLTPLVLALALALATVPGMVAAEAQGSAVLTPSRPALNLVAGTPGSAIPPITYTGSVPLPNGTVSCEVVVTPYGSFGLEVRAEPSCTLDSTGPTPVARISVLVAFDGVYRGGSGGFRPFSASLVYYDGSGYSSFMPLEVAEVNVNWVRLSIRAEVASFSLKPAFYPPNPGVGGTIRIYTVGDVIVKAAVEGGQPDVATQLVLKYEQPPPGISGAVAFTIGQGASGEVVVATLRNASVNDPLRYWVLSGDGSVEVASGAIDLPNTVPNKISGGIMLLQPYATIEYEEGKEVVVVRGGVFVTGLSGQGEVRVLLAVGGMSSDVVIGPGDTNRIIMLEVRNVNKGATSGFYMVNAAAPGLSQGSVTVSFSLGGAFSLGGMVGRLLQYMFMVLVGASAMATVSGYLLRQAGMVTGGLLGMAAATLVFLVPSLIAYVLSLAFAAGIQDPVGVGNVNMLTLGDAVERSITYVVSQAREIASTLLAYATYSISIVFTISAFLSIFIGAFSALAQAALMWAAISFFAAHLLVVMAYAYGVVVTVAFLILFFAAVLYALYAAFTGDIGRALWPVMQFSVLVLLILFVPPILASIKAIPEKADCPLALPIGEMITNVPGIGLVVGFISGLFGVDLKEVKICIPPILQWVAVTIVEIIILASVVFVAINRVVSALGGGL